jgi:hypothetical protein
VAARHVGHGSSTVAPIRHQVILKQIWIDEIAGGL